MAPDARHCAKCWQTKTTGTRLALKWLAVSGGRPGCQDDSVACDIHWRGIREDLENLGQVWKWGRSQ